LSCVGLEAESRKHVRDDAVAEEEAIRVRQPDSKVPLLVSNLSIAIVPECLYSFVVVVVAQHRQSRHFVHQAPSDVFTEGGVHRRGGFRAKGCTEARHVQPVGCPQTEHNGIQQCVLRIGRERDAWVRGRADQTIGILMDNTKPFTPRGARGCTELQFLGYCDASWENNIR